jgi:uncharacterized delta-60 repeat protein
MNIFQQLEPRRLFTAGELDASFGINGSKTLHETGDVPAEWTAVVALPGGKYLAAGTINTASEIDPTSLLIARYQHNGTLDTAFGTGGFAIIDVGIGEDVAHAYAIPDGYLLRGRLDNQAATFKITLKGTLDLSFGGGDGILQGLSVHAAQSDGKFFAVNGATFGRFLTNGSSDASFNNGAMINLTVATPLTSTHPETEILLQKSGKVIAYGTGLPLQGAEDNQTYFARWTSSGVRDSNFGKNGLLITRAVGASSLDQSDRIVADVSSVYRQDNYQRFTADGVVDASFNTFAAAGADSLVVDASNRILIRQGRYVYRYDAQGNYDRRFGFFASDSFSRFNSGFWAFAVDSDQQIIAVGSRNSLPMVQRIQTKDDGRAVLYSKQQHSLAIYGASAADRLDVTYSYAKQTMTYVLNGKSATYPLHDVRSISFYGGAGNDVARFSDKYASFYFAGDDGNDDCKVLSSDRYASLYGGKGNDRLDASGIFAKYAGHGWLQGDDGDDTLIGSNKRDDLQGNRGNDVLIGQAGDDSLDGGSGNDSLNGGDDYDKLRGGEGNDTLEGGGYFDQYQGGRGNDVYKMADGYSESAYDGINEGDDIAYVDSLDKKHGYFGNIEKVIVV